MRLPSSHKRSKSAAALSLLRRKDRSGDDDAHSAANSDDGSQHGVASIASASAPLQLPSMSHQSSMKGQSSRLSAGGASRGRSPSYQHAATPASKYYATLYDKGNPLEQSVRKFRYVEAMRNGATASNSKAIRETADGARTSTSTLETQAAGGRDDTSILHLAIQCAEYPVVEYVLSDGAASIDINARDKDGNTPLHVAAQQGRTQVVRLLLDQKDINDSIANSHGRLPIDLARNPEIFQLLQLSRSIFADNKVKEVQGLIARGDYTTLAQVLEQPRFKTVLDINSNEFASEPMTVQAGDLLSMARVTSSL